jgi:dTDP-4-dehydrorhamnose reductase
MSTIAILGANGQLGRDLCARLPLGIVRPLTRAEIDIADASAIKTVLSSLQPGIVINCAAYNYVDKAEDDAAAAFAINAFAVRNLAEVCRQLNAVLVHFSTDYVFGLEGFRPNPYKESDPPGPVSVYGLSKLTGEYFVRSICPKHFVIRTCGLYGRHGVGGKGGNFVETMLRVASQGKPLKVVEDQILTPTSTADLAAAVLSLIEEAPFGLYHLTNTGQCSWYEFATTIFELSGVQANLTPISSADYGSRARRPEYSVLGTEHPNAPRLRPWREALAEYLAERKRGNHP